jgi:aminoglycoside phosphotransferase (APT) family kinase protein
VQPLAYCPDTAVTGAEFYVTGFVDGLVLADRATGLQLPPSARLRAADQVIDVLVALHSLDLVSVGPGSAGLGELVRRTGYVERQLRRWHAQVHPSVSFVSGDLALLCSTRYMTCSPGASRRSAPGSSWRLPAGEPDLRAGRYRGRGLRLGARDYGRPDGRSRLAGRELAGPRGRRAAGDAGPSTSPGFPARALVMDRYARLSGRDVSDLPYWVAFARWRSACIGVGVRARYLAGHMADDGYLAQADERAGAGVRLAEVARDALCDTW